MKRCIWCNSETHRIAAINYGEDRCLSCRRSVVYEVIRGLSVTISYGDVKRPKEIPEGMLLVGDKQ